MTARSFRPIGCEPAGQPGPPYMPFPAAGPVALSPARARPIPFLPAPVTVTRTVRLFIISFSSQK